MLAQQNSRTVGSTKVAVVMPSRPTYQEAQPVFESIQLPEDQTAKRPEPTPAPTATDPYQPAVSEPKLIEPQSEAEKESVKESYVLRKPFMEDPATKEEPKKETQYPQTHIPFDAAEETPTLQRHHNEKEVHELIGGQKESLNDRLKQEKPELAHVLKDTPIKDLRKGIGINDKFLFVNELFRGDEAMYERSIKTINSFHILPEAEYWINRELKVKLGWNDNKDTVQHFYHLVRRRFA